MCLTDCCSSLDVTSVKHAGMVSIYICICMVCVCVCACVHACVLACVCMYDVCVHNICV